MHSSDPDLDVDLVCWSRHRWRDSTTHSRTQHVMMRFARSHRVFFVEDAVHEDADAVARLEQRLDASGVRVVVPHVPAMGDMNAVSAVITALLRDFYVEHDVRAPIAWSDAPHFLAMTRTLPASTVVYDYVHVSTGHAPSPSLHVLESELFSRAHIVFVDARAALEQTRARHPNVCLAPSSVDVAQLARARAPHTEPVEHAAIARPRIGCHGVIDERIDVELVLSVAALRPAWSFVFIGPIADDARRARLASAGNVHVLGDQSVDELTASLAHWDVALLPYARNDSARFSSDTPVLECMAAGLPIVASAVDGIVSPYGDAGLVHIAHDAPGMVAEIERALAANVHAHSERRWRSHDLFLATMSWDTTFEAILAALDEVRPRRRR